MIDSRNISVVVQGPIVLTETKKYPLPTTFLALRAIRKLLPYSEIIISTWNNSDHRLLDSYDCIILNNDPGSQISHNHNFAKFIPSNINRQIISTKAGLERATRKYTLKIRSDIILENLNFIKYFELAPSPDHQAGAIFSKKIVCNNFTSRTSRSCIRGSYLFHPSDHVHFGLTDDIRRLWYIPLQSLEDATWYESHIRSSNLRANELARLAPEQHLWTNALSCNGLGHLILGFDSFSTYSYELAQSSEKLMDNNFVFVPDAFFSFYFGKYDVIKHIMYEGMRKNSMSSIGITNLEYKFRYFLSNIVFFVGYFLARIKIKTFFTKIFPTHRHDHKLK